MNTVGHWDILKQDLCSAVRTLNRARGFSLTVILVAALGIGANTAALSVADFVLLRPLPFPDADSLVRLCEGRAPHVRRSLFFLPSIRDSTIAIRLQNIFTTQDDSRGLV